MSGGNHPHGDCKECRAREATITRLREELMILKGSLDMAVDRLGGTVEGRPTARVNFLQRIDELRRREFKVVE